MHQVCTYSGDVETLVAHTDKRRLTVRLLTCLFCLAVTKIVATMSMIEDDSVVHDSLRRIISLFSTLLIVFALCVCVCVCVRACACVCVCV